MSWSALLVLVSNQRVTQRFRDEIVEVALQHSLYSLAHKVKLVHSFPRVVWLTGKRLYNNMFCCFCFRQYNDRDSDSTMACFVVCVSGNTMTECLANLGKIIKNSPSDMRARALVTLANLLKIQVSAQVAADRRFLDITLSGFCSVVAEFYWPKPIATNSL